MTIEQFFLLLGILIVLGIASMVLGKVFKKRWPFWRAFEWNPLSWSRIGSHFQWAVEILIRNRCIWIVLLGITLANAFIRIIQIWTWLSDHWQPMPDSMPRMPLEWLGKAVESAVSSLQTFSVAWPIPVDAPVITTASCSIGFSSDSLRPHNRGYLP